ncbi:MAG TPA: class I SAM-dependent methyltransferase [Burkholderiales bacterium]|nr:class I SAM-dependent methyltransferase [Burkholderiales bacterium]
MAQGEPPPTYDPGVFAVGDLAQAKSIILTDEDSSTEARWKTETPYLAELIDERLRLNPGSLVLDYGCGIGRIARELIERTGCSVVGVDFSPRMRALAPQYVQSERFSACSPELFDALVWAGLRVDAALSVWVLQHCAQPALDIARIREALKAGGQLFLVNMRWRAVPTVAHGWFDDGLDIREMLAAEFDLRESGGLLPERTTPAVAASSYWACFGSRGDASGGAGNPLQVL